MAFKMKGINFGKGTGSAKGFPEVGTHTTRPDGSVVWEPSQEWKEEQNRKNTIELPKEDPLGLSENQRRLYNEARTKVIKAIQEGKEPSGYSQWLKNIVNYGGREGEEFLYQFVEPISKLDYGSAKMKRFYKKLDKALGEDGKLNTRVLNDIYTSMGIDQDPEGVNISYHNPTTGTVQLHKIKGQVEGNKMRYAEDDEGPGYDATLKGKHYTQEELDELAEIERETGISAFDPADTNKDDYVSPEEKLAYEKMMAEESGEGDSENVAIGGGGDDSASLDVDGKKDEFDPADTNQDGYIDKWERKDFKKLQEQQNQEENVNVNEYSGDEGGDEGGDEEVVTNEGDDTAISDDEEVVTNEGDEPRGEFDPRDTNQDGNVDKWEEKAAKRAAMFAKKEEYDSAYAKWNNKKMENMAKETLMNADRNPFKYGSKEHEEYINNKSRAKGLAIKQRYNKFL